MTRVFEAGVELPASSTEAFAWHARLGAFAKTLGRVLRRPAIGRMPAWAMRTVAGELADEAMLASTRVEPERLLAAGYRFRTADLESALRHMLGRSETKT
jgi:NAD dependent epimerase/dehydratase family enzyme